MKEVQSNNILQHHGIIGQKWGIRRYQNKDGSLTPAGRRKAAKMKDEYTKLTGKRLVRKPNQKNGETTKPKTIKEMSDDELKTKVNRLRMEKEAAQLQKDLNTLTPQHVSRGKKFITSMRDDVITPAAKEAGRNLAKDWLNKFGKKVLGLENTGDDTYEVLKKEVDTLELKKRKEEVTDYFNKKKNTDATSELKKEVEKLQLEAQKAKSLNTIEQRKRELEKRKKKDEK